MSTPLTIQTTPTDSRRSKLLRWGTGGLLIVMFLLFPLQRHLFTSPGKREFNLHQAKYSLLVETIKGLNIKPGELRHLRVDASLDPQLLRPEQQGNAADMVGKLAVRHHQDGSYQISLITRDEGHAGTYGYLYSDTPLPAQGGGIPSKMNAPSDLIFVREQVNAHWWVAYNDLF